MRKAFILAMKPSRFLILVALLSLTACSSFKSQLLAVSGPYKDFASCLTEKGFVMYGTDTCRSCLDQKALFKDPNDSSEDAFPGITYVECFQETEKCKAAGIESSPTWIDGQGNKYTGKKTIEELSQLSGCLVQ